MMVIPELLSGDVVIILVSLTHMDLRRFGFLCKVLSFLPL